ncbi:hypothetical protein X975_24305, partial [Stegodyphus mimosarum]
MCIVLSSTGCGIITKITSPVEDVDLDARRLPQRQTLASCCYVQNAVYHQQHDSWCRSSVAAGRPISLQTVSCRLYEAGLYTRRPVVCVPLSLSHVRVRMNLARKHRSWNQSSKATYSLRMSQCYIQTIPEGQ